jgi:hypothetical protein
MDPNITCQLFLKNDYQTPNTPGSILTIQKKKKIKKNFFPQNGPIRRENRSRNFFGKKNFFLGLGRFFEVDLGQKKVKNFFFIFRLQMAQFVQKTGLEKNLRLFVKKHQTLEAYISANMHPNIFWTLFWNQNHKISLP